MAHQRNDSTAAPTATSLLLDLLVARGGESLPARAAVAACALFGIRETAARVALVRLSASGRIEATGRGEYRFADSERDLLNEVWGWRTANERTRAWRGAYVAVHVAQTGAKDRARSSRSARALSLVGLAELDRDLYVRPDNLSGGLEGARARLVSLGLDPSARVFAARGFDPQSEARARALWNTRALAALYVRGHADVHKWLARASSLDLDEAAREAFLLGNRAIKALVYDPWLPAPLVDEGARGEYVASVKELDRVGRELWQRFFVHVLEDDARPERGLASAH